MKKSKDSLFSHLRVACLFLLKLSIPLCYLHNGPVWTSFFASLQQNLAMRASNTFKVKSLGVYYTSLFVCVQKLLEDKLINAAPQKNKIKEKTASSNGIWGSVGSVFVGKCTRFFIQTGHTYTNSSDDKIVAKYNQIK